MRTRIVNDRELSRFGLISISIAAILLGLYSFLILIARSPMTFECYPYAYGIIIFITLPLSVLLQKGFCTNVPSEARVIEFFGYYIGTYFKSGILLTLPYAKHYVISLKCQNINTEKIKVNDASGSPIEISVVIVWKVDSPAKAYYNVNNYKEFVAIQSESVIRELVSNYPYDREDDGESLRKNSDQIANELQSMLQNRLNIAGVRIMESRISHLAYSSEIAQAMLKRQQAYAVTAARKVIVQNAIKIVEEVIAHFEKNKSLEFDQKQKVQLINNLLVALISEQDTQPTLSLGN